MSDLTDWSRPSMALSRSRSLSLNWSTFALMATSSRAIADDGCRKLRCLRLDDLGRLGLAGGEQGPGALDLRPVASQGDQELAGLDLGLVADGLVLGDTQADERPRQPAEGGPRQGPL